MPINPPKRQIFYTNEQGNGILTAEELDEIAEACLAIPSEQVDQIAYNQSRWDGIHNSPRKRFFHYRGKILQVVAEVQKNGQRSHILTEEEKRERKRQHAEYEKMRRKNMPPEKKVEWKKREAERLKRNRDRINMNRWKREHANPEAWEKTRQKKRARYERRWNSLTEEQKDEIRRKRIERAKERLAKMSEEERQKYLERQKESKRHYLMKIKSGDKQKKSCKNIEENSKKDEEPSPSTSKNPNSNENIKLVAWAMWKNKMKPRQIHNFLKNSFGDVPTEMTLRNWIKGFENDDANVDAPFTNKTPAGRKRIKNETGIQEFEANKESGRHRKGDDYVPPSVKRRGRLSRGKFEEDEESSRKELERIPRKRGRPRKIQSGCMVKSTFENQEQEENASVLDTVEANTTKVLETSKDIAGIKLNDARREERMVEDELEEDFLEIE
uniref:Uncharacterized protein n=1 Tax=Acrobeloides nanus TaxID=290746 RepID=A0A914CGP5_9BILA